jgi:type II secretory pathway component PulM
VLSEKIVPITRVVILALVLIFLVMWSPINCNIALA